MGDRFSLCGGVAKLGVPKSGVFCNQSKSCIMKWSIIEKSEKNDTWEIFSRSLSEILTVVKLSSEARGVINCV